MSKEVREEKRVVTLQDLLVRATQLRDSLAVLEAQIASYNNQLNELQMVRDTLSNISNEGFHGYILLDRLGAIFIQVNLNPDWVNNVIVNIGRNVYLKTSKDEALRFVNERINRLSRIVNELGKQYRAVLDEYNAINQIIQSVYTQLEKRAEVEKSSESGG